MPTLAHLQGGGLSGSLFSNEGLGEGPVSKLKISMAISKNYEILGFSVGLHMKFMDFFILS